MHHELALRQGTSADLDAMYRLDQLCFDPPFRFTRRAMAHYAQSVGARTIVAEQEGRLLGFLIVQLELASDPRGAYLVTLDVEPGYRRRGLAGRLLTEAEQVAFTASAALLWLHVWTGNHPAVRFYERLGYDRAGLAPNYYGPGMDAILYCKALSSVSEADNS